MGCSRIHDLVVRSIGMWVPNMMSSWCSSVCFFLADNHGLCTRLLQYTPSLMSQDMWAGPVGGRIGIGTFFMVMRFAFVSSMTDSSQIQWGDHVFLQSWLDFFWFRFMLSDITIHNIIYRKNILVIFIYISYFLNVIKKI